MTDTKLTYRDANTGRTVTFDTSVETADTLAAKLDAWYGLPEASDEIAQFAAHLMAGDNTTEDCAFLQIERIYPEDGE